MLSSVVPVRMGMMPLSCLTVRSPDGQQPTRALRTLTKTGFPVLSLRVWCHNLLRSLVLTGAQWTVSAFAAAATETLQSSLFNGTAQMNLAVLVDGATAIRMHSFLVGICSIKIETWSSALACLPRHHTAANNRDPGGVPLAGTTY